MKKIVHLVFQTHWDREWYFTFERYRYRLMHVVERAIDALENHEIESFILDGQTLPLEDYLEVCELKDKERILKLIEEGRMIIGPWYIAMDEFLVQGESIIRNLEIGHKIAKQYGPIQRVGYLPDTFGHIGQMPQILNDFSIDNAIMWRGIEVKQSEFIWQGSDESKLFTIFLVDGYYRPDLNQNDYITATKALIDRIEPYTTTKHMLITAGGDHLMPIRENLKKRMEDIEKTYPNYELKVSSYESFLKNIKDEQEMDSLDVLKGELRQNTKAYILPNVLSTRSYLKQLNQQLEDDMIGYVEPLMALAYVQGGKAPFNFVEHIWKTILQNQPHDSICGCSIDEVHLENEMRALKAKEMISSLKEGLFDKIQVLPMTFYGDHMKHIDHDDLTFSIFNPHPYTYSGVIQGSIWLNQNHMYDSFVITDENNHSYSVAIVNQENSRLFVSPLDYPPLFRPGKKVTFKAHVKDLKPLSLTMFKVTEGKSFEVDHAIAYSIENEQVKLSLNDDGSFDLFDKKKSQTYLGWHRFYSSLDAGDSYNYSKPENDQISYAFLDGEPVVKTSPISKTMTYTLNLVQPEELDSSRKFPVESKVETKIHVTLTLNHDESFVRVSTSIDQRAKDQRLRLQFPLGVLLKEHTNDSAFELVNRKSNRKEIFVAPRQKEVPVVVDSSLSMIHGALDLRGIQFFHRGLHESQMVESKGETILEVTLIRSVSHLSRDDFGSRGGAAGPNLQTPDAQCLRLHTFDYAFGPIDEKTSPVDSYKKANEFRKMPQVLKAFGQKQPSLIIKDNDDIIVTSIRLKDKELIELRLWNPTLEYKVTNLASDLIIESMSEIMLNHKVVGIQSNPIRLNPNEIKTILIQYKSR